MYDADALIRYTSLATWLAMAVFQRQPLWRCIRHTPRYLDSLWALSFLFACNRLFYVGNAIFRHPSRDMVVVEIAGYASGIVLCLIWLRLSDWYRRRDHE